MFLYLRGLISFSGRSVARYRAWFGTRRSSVRIWPPRHKTTSHISGVFYFMEFTVYVLYSKSCKKFYVGQTQNLTNRLREHNKGETKSIKACAPWQTVWVATAETRSESMALERKIKSRGAARFLADLGAKINERL